MPPRFALPCLVLLSASACAPGAARSDELVGVLTRADAALLATRPQLVAGKYARMSEDAYGFYRGTLPMFRHDWEAGRLSATRFDFGEPVWGIGDPHPENFGLLVASDGTAALEPNDLDSADRVPALFDLRRLTTGLALAARLTSPSASPKGVAAAAAQGWAEELRRLADGGAPQRFTGDQGQVVLTDLFQRSARDLASRAELSSLTVLDAGGRRLVRGVLDPAAPTRVFLDFPPGLVPSLGEVLAPLHAPVRDVVRELGAGVASWPRMRLVVLLDGPSGSHADDFLVEVKEEAPSSLAGWYEPEPPAGNVAVRVEQGARRAWAQPDADGRYFVTEWQGLPVQVRSESEANKGVKVSRLTGQRATPEALTGLARSLGALLARVHAASGPGTASRLVASLGEVGAFVDEQGAFGEACSAQTLDDFDVYRAALQDRGPLLGAAPPSAVLAPDLAAVLGDP